LQPARRPKNVMERERSKAQLRPHDSLKGKRELLAREKSRVSPRCGDTGGSRSGYYRRGVILCEREKEAWNEGRKERRKERCHIDWRDDA